MANIREIRQKYPEYDDMSDTQFVDAFHKKFYSDMPIDELYQKVGITPNQASSNQDMQQSPAPQADPERNILDRGMEKFVSFLESNARSLPDAAQGFNTHFERLTHGIMQPLLKNTDIFKEAVKDRESEYAKSKENSPIATEIGGFAGDIASTLPFMGGGAAVAGKLLPGASALGKNVLGGTLGGVLAGGAQYVSPEESRLTNAGIGATIGGALPVVGKVASKAVQPFVNSFKKLMGDKDLIAKDIVKKMLPEDLNQAFSNKMAANRLGVNITPGEASGSPILADYESKLGTSMEGQKNFLKFKRGRQAAEKAAVDTVLDRVSPSKKIIYEDFRDVARKIIQKKKDARQAKAKPYYEAAEPKEISPNTLNSLLRNKTIAKSYGAILKDPDYSQALEGFKPTSIKTLDMVKKHMGDRIGAALDKNKNYRASLIKGSQEKLLKALDKVSPDYKKARAIFSKESPKVNKLENSVMGKISNLDDTQLKSLGAQIFNPKETDIQVLRNVRDEVTKESPEIWNNFVKNEMERRLATKGLQKTGAHGSNFYSNILEDPALFKQFTESLKGNRAAQQNLRDMRKVFKDLANKRTFKGQYGKGETGMNDKRNAPSKVIAIAKQLFGGKYDKAAIELITGGEWDAYLRKAASNSKDPEKYNQLLEALKSAAKAGTIAKTTQTNEKTDLGEVKIPYHSETNKNKGSR